MKKLTFENTVIDPIDMNIQNNVYFDSLNRSFILYYNSSQKTFDEIESFDAYIYIHINNSATADIAVLIQYHGLYDEHGKHVDGNIYVSASER